MLHVMHELATALAHIHSKGIVHRDLRPEHVLMDASGGVKLCGFSFGETSHELCKQMLLATTYDSPPMMPLGGPSAALCVTHMAASGMSVQCNCMPEVFICAAARYVQQGDALTDYIATRWYRAPELLLGSREGPEEDPTTGPLYGSAIDIWAAGCLMVKICFDNVLRQYLFAGNLSDTKRQGSRHVVGGTCCYACQHSMQGTSIASRRLHLLTCCQVAVQPMRDDS